MNKLRFFTIATVVLLVVNLFLLWKMSAKGIPPSDRPRNTVIDRLGFNAAQVLKYDALIQDHRSRMKHYNREFRQLKNTLYRTLSSGSDTTIADSLFREMGRLQQQIEQVHYFHFRDIHALCNPQQEDKFNALTEDIARIFTPLPPPEKEKK